MPRLRIAFVLEQFPSVSQTFVLGQVTGLLRLGHDVRVFAAWGDPLATANEASTDLCLAPRTVYHGDINRGRWASLRYLACRFWRHPRAVLDAVNVFKHGRSALSSLELSHYAHWIDSGPESFDVLYCHFGPSGRLADRLRRAGFMRGKVVTVFHAFDLTRYVRARGPQVYRSLFKRGDAFIAITEYARKKLLALNCPEARIGILHAGVDSARFAFRPRERPEGAPLLILAVGRMMEKKGFLYALRAIALVVERGYRVRATFAGDGPLLESLRRQASELRLDEVVTFVGSVSHARVQALTDETHAMLVPSVTASDGDEEGLPTVILEALAAGVPVIATRHAGIPEVIHDEKTGLLVDERDVEALALALQRLAEDESLYNALSTGGRAIIDSSYSAWGQTKRLSSFLEELVDNQEPGTAGNLGFSASTIV